MDDIDRKGAHAGTLIYISTYVRRYGPQIDANVFGSLCVLAGVPRRCNISDKPVNINLLQPTTTIKF